MTPHGVVHGGSQHQGTVEGQQQGRDDVVGDPVRGLAQQVGGGRGDDREVGPAGEVDVVEGIGVALSVLTTNAAVVLLGAALLGGTFMGITALGFIYARDLTAGDPRRSLALMTAAFGLGQMIGPTFAGVTYGFGDSFLLPSLVATTALLVAAVLVMTLRSGTGNAHLSD